MAECHSARGCGKDMRISGGTKGYHASLHECYGSIESVCIYSYSQVEVLCVVQLLHLERSIPDIYRYCL